MLKAVVRIEVVEQRIRLAETDLSPQEFIVPGDISSAAFYSGRNYPTRLGTPYQRRGLIPRSGIIDVLVQMGAKIKLENKKVISGEPQQILSFPIPSLRQWKWRVIWFLA